MSTISDIVSYLESSGGTNVASQPAGMIDPVYGQYPAYVSQYGSGAAGVDNYAQQVLAANPDATLGDFYAGYVQGTGNPANPPSLASLQTNYPSDYQNLLNNAGYSLDTPLSSLMGGSNSDAVTGAPLDSSSGILAGSNAYVDPNAYVPLASVTQAPAATPSATTATGWQGAIENWFVRGFLIIVGVVVVAIGIVFLMHKDSPFHSRLAAQFHL